MKIRILYLLLGMGLILLNGCKKEKSFEAGGTPSDGSLQSNVSGDCLPKSVDGIYVAGTALTGTNTISVDVDVTKTGVFNIYSDTINGYYFRASGVFNSLGDTTIILIGAGIPSAQGTDNFLIKYNSSVCDISVTVLPSSGGGPAEFTLAGAGASCTGAVVNGTYAVGIGLTGSNTVAIQVNVTTIGSYTITATFQGMTFSKTGAFVSTGLQSVTLNGSGLPTTAGTNTVPITAGASTCSFDVNVIVVPIDYFPRTADSHWTYEFDPTFPDDTIIRKVIPQTLVAGLNTYNIFMASDGSGFDSSGYYRKAGGDYFEYFDGGGFIGFDPPEIWMEYVMLKDDVPVGTVWNSAAITGSIDLPPVTTLSVRFKYSIFQKDVPISITTSKGTITYQNVIVVKEEYEQYDGTNWNDITSTVGSGKSYYARGIGLIKFEFFDNTGAPDGELLLRDYTVF